MVDVKYYLYNFQKISAQINIAKSRIKNLKQAYAENLDCACVKLASRSPLIRRPTETTAIYSEENIKQSKKNILREIERLKSELFLIEFEFEPVKNALNALKREQKYILECKFVYRMKHRDILLNLQSNKEFKHKNIWCLQTIINVLKESIKIIDSIVNQEYEFNTTFI